VTARRHTTLRRVVGGALTALLAAATVSLTALPAAADSCGAALTWNGGDGKWGDPNWSGADGTPQPSSAIFIPAGSSISGVVGSVCSLAVQGTSGAVTLSGSLAVSGSPGVAIAPSTTLALRDGTYTLPDGMPLLRSGPDGNSTINVGAGAIVDVQGVVTVGDVDIQLAGGTIDGTSTSAKLAQQGSPSFEWSDGTVSGTMLLDIIATTVDCVGTCAVPAGSTLKTSSRTATEFVSGTLLDDGTIVNGGILRFLPQTTLTGSGVLRNALVDGLGNLPPTLAFGPDPRLPDAPVTGAVDVTGVALDNEQHVEVASGTNATLTGATSTFEAGGVLDGDGAAPPAGTLTVGNGATVDVAGSTTLKNGFILQLDDGSDGTHAALHGATSNATLTATVTSNQPVPGTVRWASGSVTGTLAVAGATTSIPSAPSAPSRRYLGGTLDLDGPTTMGASSVAMRQSARIQISGTTTLSAPGARFDPVSGTTGQSITVASGATLRRAPQSGVGTAAGEWATVNVPLHNSGRGGLGVSPAAHRE
jgi:fibronectin-binding autotransporter adhesin